MLLRFIFSIILIVAGYAGEVYSQLMVTSGAGTTPQQIVQNTLLGTGVTVSNVKFNGSTGPLVGNMMGTFTTGTNPTNLGLTSGVILASGGVSGAIGPNSSPSTTTPTGTTNISDPQLQALIPGYTINDAAVLEFDFVPLSDTLKFRYVFGSEEYPEFVNTSFNDVFGFFVTGLNPLGLPYNNKNIALIPNTNMPVTIDNVNISVNSQYYVNNTNGLTIQYDAFTTVLTAWVLVIPCTQYHIKIAVADAGDAAYDSGVFLEANSFTSQGVSLSALYSQPNVSTSSMIEGCNNVTLGFKLPYNAPYNINVPFTFIGGTATNGVDYNTIPNMVVIPMGQDSTSLTITPFIDGISEGVETIIIIAQTSACGYDTIYLSIQDYNQPIVIAYGDTTVCGDTVQISAVGQYGIPPYQYLWSNGVGTTSIVNVMPTVTTNYIVSLTDACGKTANDSVLVKVDCAFVDAGPDTTICFGGTAILSAIGAVQYQWNTGQNTASISVNPTVTTTYIVTGYNASGFTDYDTVTVFVNPLPIVTATSNPSTICPGATSQLEAGGAYTYVWSSNIPDISLNGQNNLPNPVVSPLVSTVYTVTGIDTNSCVNTATTPVNLSPLPTPMILVSPNPVSVFNPTVHIYDGSLSSTSWFWDLGDGNTSTISDFYHTYSDQDTGRYLVRLTVSNVFGCVDSTKLWIIVRPDGTFYIPNAFSPNGDGFNDIFKAYGMNVLEFEMFIYDRWGKMLFVTKDINEGWNGKYNNELLPTGTYVYVIFYTDAVGIKKSVSGSVTLIR